MISFVSSFPKAPIGTAQKSFIDKDIIAEKLKWSVTGIHRLKQTLHIQFDGGLRLDCYCVTGQ